MTDTNKSTTIQGAFERTWTEVSSIKTDTVGIKNDVAALQAVANAPHSANPSFRGEFADEAALKAEPNPLLGDYAFVETTTGPVVYDYVDKSTAVDNSQLEWETSNVAAPSGGAASADKSGMLDKTNGNGAISITGKDKTDQGQSSVAIGSGAGKTSQGMFAVAIGNNAGESTQSVSSVAIGAGSGGTSQGADSVDIGEDAGNYLQGAFSVAIGGDAGNNSQGDSSVAIGRKAGQTNQPANSIVISANGTEVTPSDSKEIILNAGGNELKLGADGKLYVNGNEVAMKS